MSEQGYLASQRARREAHDPSTVRRRAAEDFERNSAATAREAAIRNAGRPPHFFPGGAPLDLETPKPEDEKQGALTDEQKLDLAGGLVKDAAGNAVEVVEQVGVGIAEAADSTLRGLAQVTRLEEELAGLTSWVGETLHLPDARKPTSAGGEIVNSFAQYGAGFAMGGVIGRTAGLVNQYGRALFADGFAEFFGYDENEDNLADVVRSVEGMAPGFLPAARAAFVDALAKDEDDDAVAERFKNLAANFGVATVVGDGLFLTFKAVARVARSPALMREGHRLGLSARREEAAGAAAGPGDVQRRESSRLLAALSAMAENAMRPGPVAGSPAAQRGQVSFHAGGAPFARFDRAYRRTGEGTAMFGEGHYLAENPEVARDYFDKAAQRAGGDASGFDYPDVSLVAPDDSPHVRALDVAARAEGAPPEGTLEAVARQYEDADAPDMAAAVRAVSDDPTAASLMSRAAADYADGNLDASSLAVYEDYMEKAGAAHLARQYGGDPGMIRGAADGASVVDEVVQGFESFTPGYAGMREQLRAQFPDGVPEDAAGVMVLGGGIPGQSKERALLLVEAANDPRTGPAAKRLIDAMMDESATPAAREAAIRSASDTLDEVLAGATERAAKTVDDRARELEAGPYRPVGEEPGPYLYRVEVNDDAIATMLDWDAPIAQQPPAVLAVVEEMGVEGSVQRGADLVRLLEKQLGEQGASDFLLASGVRGTKFLDRGSRQAGQGTRNYVVFNDDDLQVVRRNDREPIQPPPVGGQRLAPEEAHRTAAWLIRSNHPPLRNLKQRGDYIQRRTTEALGGTPLPKDEATWTPEHKGSVARMLASDVKTALEHPENAAAWYKEHVDAAHRIASVKYPELRSDPGARSDFNFALAITSQGDSVTGNSASAMTAYEFRSNNGRWPENTRELGSGGKAQNVMLRAFRMYNRIEADIGPENLQKFLAGRYTVKQLKDAGLKVSGELVDQELYGSSIFGPKIGGAFFSNLEGRTTELTMDKWWTRTWGRLTGNLMADMPTQREYVRKFREAAKADPEWRRRHGITLRELRSHDGTLNAAARVYRGFSTGKYADGTRAPKGFANEDVALHKVARSVDQKVMVPSEQLNGSRRKVMREVAQQARDILKADGVDLDMADIQALVWYLEKDVYASLGQSVERITFDEALGKYLVEKEGFDAQTIANARSGQAAGAGPGNDPGRAGARGADGGRGGGAGAELDRDAVIERVRAAIEAEDAKTKGKPKGEGK